MASEKHLVLNSLLDLSEERERSIEVNCHYDIPEICKNAIRKARVTSSMSLRKKRTLMNVFYTI